MFDKDTSGTADQGDYTAYMTALTHGYTPISIANAGSNDYQDALHCAYTTTNVAYQFTCIGWQVDWRRVGPRYPRFGKDEKLWAGFIDATATTQFSSVEVSLEGSLLGLAAGLTGVAAAFLVAF